MSIRQSISQSGTQSSSQSETNSLPNLAHLADSSALRALLRELWFVPRAMCMLHADNADMLDRGLGYRL